MVHGLVSAHLEVTKGVGRLFLQGALRSRHPSDSDQVLGLIRELHWTRISLHVKILLHGAPPLCKQTRAHLKENFPSPHLLPHIDWNPAFLISASAQTSPANVNFLQLLPNARANVFAMLSPKWCTLCSNSRPLLLHLSSPTAPTLSVMRSHCHQLVMFSRSRNHCSCNSLTPPCTVRELFLRFSHPTLRVFCFSATFSISLLWNQPLLSV